MVKKLNFVHTARRHLPPQLHERLLPFGVPSKVHDEEGNVIDIVWGVHFEPPHRTTVIRTFLNGFFTISTQIYVFIRRLTRRTFFYSPIDYRTIYFIQLIT